MATPLYKRLKSKGVSTYAFPGAAEDISAAHQNQTFHVNFSKFVLLNLDLNKMDLNDPTQFHSESINPLTDKGDILINSLRNYVANHEVALREAKQTNNSYFYDPSVLATATERIFWKWMRKSGAISFETATPNDDYVDSVEFSINEGLADDYFKEYLWKERSTTEYDITYVKDMGTNQIDPKDNILKRNYRLTVGSSCSLKPGDRVTVANKSMITLGFTGAVSFDVQSVGTKDQIDYNGDTETVFNSKNNWVYILCQVPLSYNNAAVATIKLEYNRVVQYVGEISSSSNIQHENRAYTEVLAYITEHVGQTPDVLFRVKADKNYSPGLQIPILPSQDQPEIIGGELFDSPLVLNPENYPGDHYAYFDVDQKYVNTVGYEDRKRGDYYGVLENNRRKDRVVSAPYLYPEFNGSKLDGVTVDFDTQHYVRMTQGSKVTNFDEFNAKSFNGQAPASFEYNAILWYYEATDLTTGASEMNMYGISFLDSVEGDAIATTKKLVSNGKQDGLSFQYALNQNFNISSDNTHDLYDPQKTYDLFGFDLYSNVMSKMLNTNDIYISLAAQVTGFKQDLVNMKNLIYNQSDIRDINFKIQSLYNLLSLYQRNQLKDSASIHVKLDESTTPPQLFLENVDARYGDVLHLPVSVLYNKENNTVVDTKINVPVGKDFMVNIVNDDNTTTVVDRPLNVVLERDLDFRQTVEINVFAHNAKNNKRLNVSINSELSPTSDKTAGYNLLGKTLDLPVDNNLNPNVTYQGIATRWTNMPSAIYPTNVLIRNLSDTYYLVVEVAHLLASAFKAGDTITLENFELVFTDPSGTTKTNVSGQYEIVSDVVTGKLVFAIANATFAELFKKIDATEHGTASEYALEADNFTQPATIRYNSGQTITITCIDASATTFDKKYLVQIKPLHKN